MTESQKDISKPNKFFQRLVLILVLFFLILGVAGLVARRWVNSPPGTAFVAQKISEAIHTGVDVDSIHLGLSGSLYLGGVLIEDHHQDTLIYADQIMTNIFSMYAPQSDKTLNLGNVALYGGLLNLKVYKTELRNNLDMTFNPNTGPPSQEPGKPFSLDIRRLNLENFIFINEDENQPFYQQYDLCEGEIDVHELDLINNKIHLESADLSTVSTYINIFPKEEGWSLPESETKQESDGGFEEEAEVSNEDVRASPFTLIIDQLSLEDSDFELHNYDRSPEWNGNYQRVDYDHLKAEQIYLQASNFKMEDLNFYGNTPQMSFVTPFGFELLNLQADTFAVTERNALLYDVELETPYSFLKDSLEFKYREYNDWRDFNNRIFIDGHLVDSRLALRDIMHFAPVLYDNTFFINAENQVIDFDTRLVGRINSLKARKLRMNIEDEIVFVGNISSRDLAESNQQFFGADIQSLKMDILSLEKLIPNFSLPSNFEKLEDIQFKGRFDGYPLDFVTYGQLNSNLGTADLDMRLDLKNGQRNATYSGKLGLVDFDLNTWTGNADFGSLSMTVQVEEGRGFDLDNADVSLKGNIGSLTFRDYNYQDVAVNGALNKSSFDGVLSSKSESADFDFKGLISGLDSIPEYRFSADVRSIRLKDLNLSEKRFDFGGSTQISLRGLNWKELIGNGGAQEFWMIYENQDTLHLDSVYLSQQEFKSGRQLKINTEVGQLQLDGVYDLTSIHKDIVSILQTNHPKLMNLAAFPEYGKRDTNKLEYDLSLNLDDRLGVTSYFTKGKVNVDQATLNGRVSMPNQSMNWVLNSPALGLGRTQLNKVDLTLANEGEMLIYSGSIADVTVGERTYLVDGSTNGNFRADQGRMSVDFEDPKDQFQNINLNAEFEPEGKYLKMILDPAYFEYADNTWRVFPGNQIIVGKRKLWFDDFVLSSFDQVLKIDDINDGSGLTATIDDFNTDILDSLLHLNGFDFGGKFDARMNIGDLFAFKDIEVVFTQDDLELNGESEGALEASLKGRDMTSGYLLNLHLADGEKALHAGGTIASNGYDIKLDLDNMPLSLLENVITSGIHGTTGQATGEVMLKGKGPNFGLFGNLISTGATTVDYIGVEYQFDNQVVQFNDGVLDFTGVTILDTLGNKGRVTGALQHSSFKDWSMDISLTSSRMLMLNTNPQLNPDYYGTVFGNGRVEFTGSFEQPRIYVVASTMSGSNLVIPIAVDGAGGSTDFVQFVKRDTVKSTVEDESRLEGLELEMKIGITEQANMKIIFDEQAGDILEGTGRGNMVVKMTRAGDLSVYGDYEIEQGDYLFTLLNFVNKPFEVERGGRIRWTGDPVDAQVNLTAKYKDLTASPYPLVQEFAGGNDDLSDAQRPTKVDLTMKLTGSLLRPLIGFDIRVPELVGEVKTYVENKLQILRNDQQELNQQVFGLVVFNSFFPTGSQFGDNLGFNSVNTLSEFLSTQLSLFVSGLLSNIVEDVGFISGVDVDLAYVQRYDIESQSNTFQDGEYQFRVRNRLWNDRWVVTLGGNYGNQSISASGDPYFNPETVIEWNTPVRGLKLRAYYRGEDSLQGQRQLVGGGIRYRKEFDKFSEFFTALKKTPSDQNKN